MLSYIVSNHRKRHSYHSHSHSHAVFYQRTGTVGSQDAAWKRRRHISKRICDAIHLITETKRLHSQQNKKPSYRWQPAQPTCKLRACSLNANSAASELVNSVSSLQVRDAYLAIYTWAPEYNFNVILRTMDTIFHSFNEIEKATLCVVTSIAYR